LAAPDWPSTASRLGALGPEAGPQPAGFPARNVSRCATRQLRDGYVTDPRYYELRRLGRQAVFFQCWAKYGWRKGPEKQKLHQAARDLGAAIPPESGRDRLSKASGPTGGSQPKPDTAAIRTVTGLVAALRDWYDQADIWTWRWLRVPTGCFIAGAACLLVIPLSFY